MHERCGLPIICIINRIISTEGPLSVCCIRKFAGHCPPPPPPPSPDAHCRIISQLRRYQSKAVKHVARPKQCQFLISCYNLWQSVPISACDVTCCCRHRQELCFPATVYRCLAVYCCYSALEIEVSTITKNTGEPTFLSNSHRGYIPH